MWRHHLPPTFLPDEKRVTLPETLTKFLGEIVTTYASKQRRQNATLGALALYGYVDVIPLFAAGIKV